jgi:hypothetical protein
MSHKGIKKISLIPFSTSGLMCSGSLRNFPAHVFPSKLQSSNYGVSSFNFLEITFSTSAAASFGLLFPPDHDDEDARLEIDVGVFPPDESTSSLVPSFLSSSSSSSSSNACVGLACKDIHEVVFFTIYKQFYKN